MSGEMIFRPRRNGKREESRQRIFGFVAIGDVVTTEKGKGAPRYRVIDKRGGLFPGPVIIIIREDAEMPCKVWEIDPAIIRLVFEGTK